MYVTVPRSFRIQASLLKSSPRPIKRKNEIRRTHINSLLNPVLTEEQPTGLSCHPLAPFSTSHPQLTLLLLCVRVLLLFSRVIALSAINSECRRALDNMILLSRVEKSDTSWL